MFTGMRHTVLLVLGCLLVILALDACGGVTSKSAPAVAQTPVPSPDIESTDEASITVKLSGRCCFGGQDTMHGQSLIIATLRHAQQQRRYQPVLRQQRHLPFPRKHPCLPLNPQLDPSPI